MSSRYETPDEQSITSLMSMFFGDDLIVTNNGSTDLSDRYTATFIDDENELVALCACDRHFVAYAGAALSMIPADVANEMVVGSEPNDAILGNFYEVMNICSKLLMSDSSAHLRLDKALAPEHSTESIALLRDKSDRLSAFELEIPGYGKGSLIFLVS